MNIFKCEMVNNCNVIEIIVQFFVAMLEASDGGASTATEGQGMLLIDSLRISLK